MQTPNRIQQMSLLRQSPFLFHQNSLYALYSVMEVPLFDPTSYAVVFVVCSAIVAEGDTMKAKRKEASASRKSSSSYCRGLLT